MEFHFICRATLATQSDRGETCALKCMGLQTDNQADRLQSVCSILSAFFKAVFLLEEGMGQGVLAIPSMTPVLYFIVRVDHV
ncbi:hypothetical protein C8J48_2988 [Desmospora activa DSM 45169]|uniref:Uncharacterized protein n=1 Tax=Desmospora activa DSM 45169 TaxID=1121389 RepID=A0A2T4Z432_9BACL|nr:hypothetical protein C8J48_2988 [Desmospora activa DSM 45169]